MSREAMQMALEALEEANQTMSFEYSQKDYYSEAIAALRQALVKPEQNSDPSAWRGWVLREVLFDNGEPIGHRELEQEPVAWANSFDLQNFDMKVRTCPDLHHTVPLYTTPQKREWVGLTDDDEIPWDGVDAKSFARAVEQALKEKNHG